MVLCSMYSGILLSFRNKDGNDEAIIPGKIYCMIRFLKIDRLTGMHGDETLHTWVLGHHFRRYSTLTRGNSLNVHHVAMK